MGKKKDQEYVVVDGVKYAKGTEPKSRAEIKSAKVVPEEGGMQTGTENDPPKIRKDVQASDYSTSVASAKRKADNAKNN